FGAGRGATSQLGPLPAPRNRKYGINFTSRGFGDKILKFYLLKYNKCSMLGKRCGVKFEIPLRITASMQCPLCIRVANFKFRIKF
ncbi:hypothetical protein, partial [uncultured Campylobacter sp.]|uniref:hypothetical protein n=1 Tax=uncultured Campylobacter sp. TaxID=218934 RepID=UPI0025DC01B6